MDKETLSNYGWIVICVLVLAVMIALATPFGTFVADAVKSTTQGLFDVNQNALDAAGVPGLTVQDQEFADTNGGSETETNTPVKFGEKYIVTTDNLDGTWYGMYYIFYSDGSFDSTQGNESAGFVTYTETEIIPNGISEGISMVVSSDGTTITQLYNGETILVIYTLESAIQ